MQITLELPEDIAEGLESKWNDLARAALESLALEAYRSHALTAAQLRRLLAFETRMEVDAFLKKHEIFDYSGRGFRTGSGDSSGAANERGSVLRSASRC
jgi:hypothetical protein